MQDALNATPEFNSALATKTLECGIRMEVHGGFDAYSSDLLVTMLCKSKTDLCSVEEAALLNKAAQDDDGIEFDGADYAKGVIRLSGAALRAGHTSPAALALAHVYVEANRGFHVDLGLLLKLNLRVGPAHIHRMGVGLGLNKVLVAEMCKQVVALVQEFQRTAKEDATVMWTLDESLGACEDFALRKALHNALLEAVYAPLLHVTEDSVA